MLQSSVFVTGTVSLINDATTAAILIGGIGGILALIYCLFRRSHSEEMDQKKWKDRAMVALTCTIAIPLAAAFVKLLLSYYGVAA